MGQRISSSHLDLVDYGDVTRYLGDGVVWVRWNFRTLCRLRPRLTCEACQAAASGEFQQNPTCSYLYLILGYLLVDMEEQPRDLSRSTSESAVKGTPLHGTAL